MNRLFSCCLTAVIGIFGAAPAGFATEFLDAGFEDYSVPDGSFVRPSVGPWQFSSTRFANTFVVDPTFSPTYSWPNDTRSATFAPQQGEQYVSTYAGLGGLQQNVTFDRPGIYRISTYAASPAGDVLIPTLPGGTQSFPLASGEFRFLVHRPFGYDESHATLVGEKLTTQSGATWSQFNSLFTLNSPGTFQVVVQNTKTANYFIYYDNFDVSFVRAIPESSSQILMMAAGLILSVRRSASALC